jgi:hypothetical protein
MMLSDCLKPSCPPGSGHPQLGFVGALERVKRNSKFTTGDTVKNN